MKFVYLGLALLLVATLSCKAEHCPDGYSQTIPAHCHVDEIDRRECAADNDCGGHGEKCCYPNTGCDARCVAN
ncbi:hypothetical protein C0Q70_20992 [Pomacea canaliculata]|uniref:WAP domain-containing protein n=1 Tax=Pomacea canaliculata TaxID=400727 RepID=A0A2T7NBA0_POMCA|nr:hypothetical protein C0Q70_20992 [Pomacea canaliculata]